MHVVVVQLVLVVVVVMSLQMCVVVQIASALLQVHIDCPPQLLLIMPQLSPVHGELGEHWHIPWPEQLIVAPVPPGQTLQAPQCPVASQICLPLALDWPDGVQHWAELGRHSTQPGPLPAL